MYDLDVEVNILKQMIAQQNGILKLNLNEIVQNQ